MSEDIEVRIDGRLVTPAEIEAWEARRARAVLKSLRKRLKLEGSASMHHDDLPSLRAEILRLKEQCGRDGLRKMLDGDIRLSNHLTNVVLAFSGSRRKPCVTEVRVFRCNARQISRAIDDLMSCDTSDNRRSNLQACPDHYLLEPRGDILEVIETTGGSPRPAQFFLTFGDESGLTTPRDPSFAYQSMGTARSSLGKVIGGVRHQFRDEGDNAWARLMVEFPAAMPQRMIREAKALISTSECDRGIGLWPRTSQSALP